MNKQTRLQNLDKPIIHTGAYNKVNDEEQWIRLSSGCPNGCPYCYEPKEEKVYQIPDIVRNKVKIMDMNLLSKKVCIDIIKELCNKTVNKKLVYYELICGIDWRFLNEELVLMLKSSRFINIRLAWDFSYVQQFHIRKAMLLLTKAGYKSEDITIFMLCNWKISYMDCCLKLDLCKIWNVKVADCWYDNQLSPNIIPLNWNDQQIKKFRKKVRKHNQLVNFKIDPEVKNEL